MVAKIPSTKKKTVGSERKTSKPVKSEKIAKITPTKKSTSLAVKKPFTKSQILEYFSTETGVKKKDLLKIFSDLLPALIKSHLTGKGPGEINFMGLFKLSLSKKPATPARVGINSFTGQETTFAAKPACFRIKLRALKKLKQVLD